MNKLFKKIDMKKILFLFSISSLLVLTGCLKDKPLNDFSKIGTIIELPYHGLEGFSSDAVLVAGQTDPIVMELVVNIASTYPLNKDLTVTIGVDDAKRTAYNAKGGVQYTALPNDAYALSATTATIKAGSRQAKFTVTVYPDKVPDPTVNYMFAVSIKDAQGETISGNFGTAYYHIIGNPIAGDYNWDFYRWNNPTGTGSTNAGTFSGEVITFLPVDPTTIVVPTGYFTQPNYQISFDNNGGTLSNFKVVPAADMLQSWSDNGITITTAPNFLIADPVAGHYKVNMIVFNGTAYRFLIDDYYK